MAARMRSLGPEQFLAYARVFPQAWEAVLNAPIEHVVFGTGHISAYEDGSAPLIYVVFEDADGPVVERRFEARAIASKYFRGFCAPEPLCQQVAEFWAQQKQKQKNEQFARQVEQKVIQRRTVNVNPAPAKPARPKAASKNQQKNPVPAGKEKSDAQGCPYCSATVFPKGLERHIQAAHKKLYKTWKQQSQRQAPQKMEGRKQKQSHATVVECSLCYKWMRKSSLREHYERFHPEYVMPAEPRRLTPEELKKYHNRPKRARLSGYGVLTPISMRMIVVRRRR